MLCLNICGIDSIAQLYVQFGGCTIAYIKPTFGRKKKFGIQRCWPYITNLHCNPIVYILIQYCKDKYAGTVFLTYLILCHRDFLMRYISHSDYSRVLHVKSKCILIKDKNIIVVMKILKGQFLAKLQYFTMQPQGESVHFEQFTSIEIEYSRFSDKGTLNILLGCSQCNVLQLLQRILC